MKTSELSFLSSAEKLTLGAYQKTRKYSTVASEVISRLAAAILLSSAAALDFVLHTLLVVPTFVYAIGKSIYQRQADFTLPWQHLQRVRNAIAPLLLGSAFGVLHPFAGLAMSEATDKHAVIGMLSSHGGQNVVTPCSPIHSLSIVENVAKNHQYGELSGEQGKKEIFSAEYIKILKDARSVEESLESLQAQEFIHKITNITLFVMATIKGSIENSCLSDLSKAILVRVSGLLVPILTVVDMTINLLVQALFVVTGVTRFISGRGPIYTEVTTKPLMHASFLIQNILKLIGNIIGLFIWFVSPKTGFKASLLPANLFFKLQLNIVMLQIRWKMHFSQNNEIFVVPVVFENGENGECSALSLPTHSMHKTYLIVEKKDGDFNLYWVDRPNISYKRASNTKTLEQIRSMLDNRFPFMDIKKLMEYPVKSNRPAFLESEKLQDMEPLGGRTNCVVSNLFGMFVALDRIRGKGIEVTNLRYQVVREALIKDYEFYNNDFFPFANESDGYSLKNMWAIIKTHPQRPI